ncbi:Hypothetical predicted protein [Mytilus galloprovincialis]|uniref:Tc1-like transposase DDE domain-containing protein n=1 Tax=Mytilus galloprovincialis TaxID=29158 RepID=A0A8B6ES73_MYTGA|nr:Hypothetical predicted protein [Mytilus galloprovincialis]
MVQETDRFGGGGIMVWGEITYQERTELKIIVDNLNATRYGDEILAPVVLPFLRRHCFNHVFQQTTPCHVAHISMTFLENNHIRVLPWPAMSPDLSPIEHLWNELGRRIRNSQNTPETWEKLAQLRTTLFREWNNIPQDFIRCLIDSMRLGCQAVINARGGHTKY